MTPAQVAARIAGIIRTRPAAWDQRVWIELDEGHSHRVASMRAVLDDPGACGTVACIAGWAAILAAPEGTRAMGLENAMIRRLILPDDTVTEVKEAGRAALGLDPGTAYRLFDSELTRDQALAALDDIAAGRPATLPAWPEDEDDDETGELP